MKIHFESYQPLTGPFLLPKSCQYNFLGYKNSFSIFSKYGHIISYLSISVSRDESLNPFANGLLSILSLVICKTKGKRSEVLMQFLHFRFHLELTYQVLLFNAYLILMLPCRASLLGEWSFQYRRSKNSGQKCPQEITMFCTNFSLSKQGTCILQLIDTVVHLNNRVGTKSVPGDASHM